MKEYIFIFPFNSKVYNEKPYKKITYIMYKIVTS